MNIRVLSDLHLEFYAGGHFEVLDPRKDTILVLAGDIHVWAHKNQYKEFVRQCSEGFGRVVLVLGNHEFYGSEIQRTVKAMTKMAKEFGNVYLLNKDYVLIDDVVFFGTTLWTDMNDANPLTMLAVHAALNDFVQIKYGKKVLTPELWLEFHREERYFLETTLETFGGSRCVVVTHHPPSRQSIPQTFRTDQISDGFASDMDKEIRRLQPDLWIHGHIHNSCDYNIGKTRIVCNPRGYPHQQNYNFDPYFEVTV